MCSWRHKIRKIAVEILQSVNNRTQSLREIAYYAWLLLTYIVINTLLGGLTLDPAGMHCPSWDDAFVSSCRVAFSICIQHVISAEIHRSVNSGKHISEMLSYPLHDAPTKRFLEDADATNTWKTSSNNRKKQTD